MKIPNEELDKYHVGYGDIFDTDASVYRTYLLATDYICNKIVEGVATKEDYATELKYRKIAREEL